MEERAISPPQPMKPTLDSALHYLRYTAVARKKLMEMDNPVGLIRSLSSEGVKNECCLVVTFSYSRSLPHRSLPWPCTTSMYYIQYGVVRALADTTIWNGSSDAKVYPGYTTKETTARTLS